MEKNVKRLAKGLCVLVAVLITAYLYRSKLPPFSLVGPQEETIPVTGVIPDSAESPIVGGEPVIVFVPASLDQTLVADESGLRMQDGANTWTKTITLTNPSAEPAEVYFFAQGLKVCSETDTKDCVQFPSQVTVGANESKTIKVAFSEISPEDSVPTDGKLILAGTGLLKEFPFSIRGAWQKEPVDYPEMTGRSITGGFTLLLVGIVISLLYNILLTKVSPFFLPENSLSFTADISDENKPLWATFHSRLRELKEQGLGGNFVNPQPPADTIDLPTSLGREGDILRAVIELLNWVLPRRGKSIRLETANSQTNGKGLSVSIVSNSNGEVLAERVFWSGQYNLEATTTDIEEILMTPAILWLSTWKSKQNGKNLASDQGWEIEAYCRLACSLWSTDRELGRKLYLDVLRRDPHNKRAHLGLGRIFIEDSHQKDISTYERDKRLKLAVAYLEEVSVDPVQPDSVWIAAEYNLAVSRLYLDDLGKAKIDCDQLVSKLNEVPKLNKGDKTGLSRIWLDLNAINVAIKQILRQKPHKSQNQQESDELKALLDIYNDDPEFWTSFTTMSLILKHIVMLKDEPPQNEDDLERKINEAIAELAQHIHSKFDPDQLLLINLHYRSQYNVACYLSRCYLTAKTNRWTNKNQYAELALDYLRLALAHGGGLLMLAREDPALEPLRRDRRKKFDYIVGGTAADEEVEEDQNVTRIVVQGPIVLKSEETALPSQGLEPKNKKIGAKAKRITSRT